MTVTKKATCSYRFTEYQAELVKQKKEQFRNVAVFPCKLRVMAEHVYTRRDPIVCGVSEPVTSEIVIVLSSSDPGPFIVYANSLYYCIELACH